MQARAFKFLSVLLLLAVGPTAAFASGVSVPMDEVRVVAFEKPVATVYIGNAAIADVNMIDATHAFLLGKSYGQTNLIALDSAGKQVANRQVSVYARAGNTVTVNRGAEQMTYACNGARCEFTPKPGDDKDAYATAMGQISQHQDMSMKSASANAGK